MIVVVGLAFEARIAAGPDTQIVCSGNGKNLAESISRAIANGCEGLLSFGVAGGLDPKLAPGTCVIGSDVLSGEQRRATDRRWSEHLLKTIPNPVHGTLLGVPAPVATPEDKRALYLQTGAVAVDMESHVVADVAAAHGLPMAAIRVVTDPATRAIPEVALAAMRPNGTIDASMVFRSLLRRPCQLLSLLQIAIDARAARATLRQGRAVLGPGFGNPDFSGGERNRRLGAPGRRLTAAAQAAKQPMLLSAE